MHWLIFWLCFWLALILFLTVYYKDVKTYLGDLELKKELDKLPKDKYMVINKVMIKDDNGKKTEIDSIILSKYGIFVIKLMKKNGTIEVYEQQNAWKVIKNGKESFISNLIVENNNNIKLISKLLNIDPKYFISIICFPNKTKIITNNNYITQIDYLNYLISQITNPILNINLIPYKNILINNDITSIQEKETKNNIEVCPQCGSKLIEIKEENGTHKECTNKEKCNYTTKQSI